MTRLTARSISRSVRELLQQTPFVAHVLAVFDHACDLSTPDGAVIALVTPLIGDGPLNIVVDAEPGEFKTLAQDTTATQQKANLQIGAAQIDLSVAAVWEPRPDWNALRSSLDIIAGRLPLLKAIVTRHTGPATNRQPEKTQPAQARPASSAPRFNVGPLQAGWNGDLAQLRQGATQLAGLGSGLTPAGDDFLCGVMLWAWLAHPAPQEYCQIMAETAAPRTTTLSAAFLRSAAKGECNSAWHRLMNVLASGSNDELDAATRQVLAYGATSGADTMAGFLALEWHDGDLPSAVSGHTGHA